MFKKLLLLVFALAAIPAYAQVSVPNTFVSGARILASEMNANFDALESNALNRTGGTITGNISVDSGITVDGVDIGAVLSGTGNPTFATITTTGNGTIGGTLGVTGNFAVNTNKFTVTASSGNTLVAGTLDVTGAADFAGAATFGSGNVALIDSTGKIAALSSTTLANLSGVNLTGIALLGSNNTFTARNDFKNYTETATTVNPSGGAITYDLSTTTQFITALSGAATVTISNVPAPTNGVVAFTVKFTADGTLRDFTWPASVKWPGGTDPGFSSTSGRVDIFTFISYDGGTTWYGFSTPNFS